MKKSKSLLVLLICFFVLWGCKQEKQIQLSLSKRYNLLSSQDAESVFHFLEQTIQSHASEVPFISANISTEMWINKEGQLILSYLGDSTISLTVINTEENTYEDFRYLIDSEYYVKEFYPFLSRMYDKYCPLIFQLHNAQKLIINIESKDSTVQLSEDNRSILFDIADHVSLYWKHSQVYSGNLNDYIYKIDINDNVINEILYIFDSFLVINGKKIDYYFDPDLDQLFSET